LLSLPQVNGQVMMTMQPQQLMLVPSGGGMAGAMSPPGSPVHPAALMGAAHAAGTLLQPFGQAPLLPAVPSLGLQPMMQSPTQLALNIAALQQQQQYQQQQQHQHQQQAFVPVPQQQPMQPSGGAQPGLQPLRPQHSRQGSSGLPSGTSSQVTSLKLLSPRGAQAASPGAGAGLRASQAMSPRSSLPSLYSPRSQGGGQQTSAGGNAGQQTSAGGAAPSVRSSMLLYGGKR
jgi:hypothetical protein